MTIEKMEEKIADLRRKKESYVEEMERKIVDMTREHDSELIAQTQRIFVKNKLSPDMMNRLKYANREQLIRVLDFINNEIRLPNEKKQGTPPDKSNDTDTGGALKEEETEENIHYAEETDI